MADQYVPDPARYDGRMPYRRCGRSGLKLPAVSLGFWHNFGDDKPLATQRAIMRKAFDLGITHFDLANNYDPPPGAAERNFGRILHADLAAHRDQVTLDLARRGDLAAGEERVARDRIGEVDVTARAKEVRAESFREGIVATLNGAACDGQAQGEHAQDPCDRCHFIAPQTPARRSPGYAGQCRPSVASLGHGAGR